MLRSSLFILFYFFSISCSYAQNTTKDSTSNIQQDTFHKVILYLVDKRGIETGEIDSNNGMVRPCKNSFTAIINKKPFLGKRRTQYDDCSGKWMFIEYYFIGIRTRTRYNQKFPHKNKK